MTLDELTAAWRALRTERDALAAACAAAEVDRDNALADVRTLEAALRSLRDTVGAMRHPQTVEDFGLLLFKFAGPMKTADALLKQRQPAPAQQSQTEVAQGER